MASEAFDAAVEVVECGTNTLKFCGEDIPVKPLPSILRLKFAKAASRGAESNDVEGQAAILDVIHGVVLPSARARFDQLAEEHEADDVEMLKFASEAMQMETGRPTKPSSSSPKSVSSGSKKSNPGSVVDLGDGRIVEMQPGETTAHATARALLMPVDDDDELDGIQAASQLSMVEE